LSHLAEWAEEELSALEQAGLRRSLEARASPQGPEVRIGSETLVNFSSNDYLGLAAEPRLANAALRALERHGVGAGGSRLLGGDTAAHRELEAKLARFERTEAAVLFNSGYAANLGILSALAGPEDAVFSDELNHASIIDGCRLSRARVEIYPHADAGALDALVARTDARRKLVVTDAVFSMDGDRAPLRDLVELCRARGAALVVDEAHATGVLGARGAGLCDELGVEDQVDVRMGTLGKALGVFGAYAATSASVAELRWNRARSYVFSTALPPAVCAAAQEAVRIVEEEPGHRARLWANVERFASGLSALGLPAPADSAIFPLVLGSADRAMDAARKLRERGLLVRPIRPPTVPLGTSRLRIALSAAHSDRHVDALLEALAELHLETHHAA
jgi:8-amino-7-oxononanoate synthase